MRASHLATALTAFSAGLSAATVLHRRAERRLPPAPTRVAPAAAPAPATPEADGVVLPFLRTVPATPAPAPAAGPARCGDAGGRTKAGTPCGARATAGGRCHHHPLAA
ncbi:MULTISPECIES: hypothetical protein [unclassified Blastococcus]